MKFFFPDSRDLVDPTYDFENESHSETREQQRTDQYAHEVFSSRLYDGLLVSKGIVDGYGENGSRYSLAQRHRLLRVGAHEFFRLKDTDIRIMGDCGAFTYVREEKPPYTVDEVIQFYCECGFDLGISVDHIILAFQSKWDETTLIPDLVPTDFIRRQELTLQLADEFLKKHRQDKLRFEPVGVAQGWSPKSYANAVEALQKIGYGYIAIGGLVPLKTKDILASLRAIGDIRLPNTRLHLLGVTRTDHINDFARLGVVSFDSTSPLRQAFKDDRDNYYTLDRTYTAIRVPQVDGNQKLMKRIAAGQISQERARKLERDALEALKGYDSGEMSLEDTVDAIVTYDSFCEPGKDHGKIYTEVLSDRPWQQCSCDVCRKLRYHVIMFRGAERNRRRGFHNVWVFCQRLQRQFGIVSEESAGSRS